MSMFYYSFHHAPYEIQGQGTEEFEFSYTSLVRVYFTTMTSHS